MFGKKLLFIGSGSPFMMNAVINNFKEAGFEVNQTEPKIRELRKYRFEDEPLLLYLGNDILDNMEFLVYIKDVFTETGNMLFVIGENVEIKDFSKTVPERLITKSFAKPIDIHDVVLDIEFFIGDPDMKHKKQILLVDDDGDYLKLISEWLSVKYRVVIVNSGMQAITFLANNRPDLILLDYEMPITTGPQVHEMINSEPGTRGIPVIYLTGRNDPGSVLMAAELKPDGYLLKSIGRSELLMKIDSFFMK